jgi:hypothetical protein
LAELEAPRSMRAQVRWIRTVEARLALPHEALVRAAISILIAESA